MIIKKEFISGRFKYDGKAILPLSDRQVECCEKLNADSRINYLLLEQCVLCKHKNFIQIAGKDRYGVKLATVVCEK